MYKSKTAECNLTIRNKSVILYVYVFFTRTKNTTLKAQKFFKTLEHKNIKNIHKNL